MQNDRGRRRNDDTKAKNSNKGMQKPTVKIRGD